MITLNTINLPTININMTCPRCKLTAMSFSFSAPPRLLNHKTIDNTLICFLCGLELHTFIVAVSQDLTSANSTPDDNDNLLISPESELQLTDGRPTWNLPDDEIPF